MYNLVHKEASFAKRTRESKYNSWQQNDGRLLYSSIRGYIFAVWVKCEVVLFARQLPPGKFRPSSQNRRLQKFANNKILSDSVCAYVFPFHKCPFKLERECEKIMETPTFFGYQSCVNQSYLSYCMGYVWKSLFQRATQTPYRAGRLLFTRFPRSSPTVLPLG